MEKVLREGNPDVTDKLGDIEHRLAMVEALLDNVRKECKVCDEPIDGKNTSMESLLVELCDKCWQTQDEVQSEFRIREPDV